MKELLVPPKAAGSEAGPAHPPSAPEGERAAGVKAYGVVCFFGAVFGIASDRPLGAAVRSTMRAKTWKIIARSIRKPRSFYAKVA